MPVSSQISTPASNFQLDYGLDAPNICRGLFIAGAAGTLLVIATVVVLGNSRLTPFVTAFGVMLALYGFLMGGYMVWSSRVGKLRTREYLLDEVGRLRRWTGAETVLDVGCGRGLMLIGAARRLTTGTAVGVDLWSSKDQAGNWPEATRANAIAEAVLDRVRVKTADARALPLPDSSVDVVISHWVVHNLASREDRSRAVNEMWRVLKPGGVIALADIAFVREYANHLTKLGAAKIYLDRGGWQASLFGILSGGSFRPQTVFAMRL
jgi:SAM-dependent methyltransferase